MRWILLVALAACTETHDGTAMELSHAAGDCEVCHKTDADPTARLPHPNGVFPTVNPNPLNVPTMHTGIACQDCHHFDRGPGIEMMHADCTKTCHLQSQASACCSAVEPNHLGRVNPTDSTIAYAWDATNHDFCLGCHPQGLKDPVP